MPIIGRYERLPAVCQEWDPRATAVARIVDELVREQLPEVEVEHVGSTSVPDCAGKGIVDLQVVFASAERREAIKRVLAELGFQSQQSRDPFPEERPMRVGALDYDGARFRIHAHVVPADSPEPAQTRAFRDRLRADLEFRAAYVAHKRAILAAGTSDTLEYSYAKGPFIEAALREGK